ncbi:major facilitator superfamily domain-containing protein [Tuber brumale]|nr:major facilitator superfamily domain-containing protein [Tuber brumale]
MKSTNLESAFPRSDGNDTISSTGSQGVILQTGVQRVEAVAKTWTRRALYVAYAGIFLMAFCTSVDIQVTSLLAFYATSSFSSHSLLSTVGVVGSVLMAVVQPPMAKIADVFGRTEAFAISMLLYILGYIQMAASKNISTYASAQIFYAAGSTGLRILQQIFIADTSDLLNRALLSSLPDTPFLITVWVGPEIAEHFTTGPWRWGYAMWTIITPVLSLPLFIALWVNQRKASKAGLLPEYPWKAQGIVNFLKSLWTELDIMGVLLLVAAFSLLLVPLTLGGQAVGKWKNPSIIAAIVIGGVCLILFPLWEMWKKAAPTPLLTLRLFKNRTVIAGCVLGFFYFMAYYLSLQPYFYSYLMVARNTGSVAAGHITLTFSFAATVSSVIISLVIKYTKHYKYYMIGGILIYMLGIGLMLRYRNIDSSNAQVIWTQIIVGIGGGMLNVPAQLGVQAASLHQEVAAATALFLTIVSIGGAVGSAVSGAIWSHNIQNKLMLYLPETAKVNMTMIYGSAVMATSYPMGSPERAAIIRSYDETMRILLIIAVCVCIPMLPAGLCMANYKLDEVDQRVEGVVFGSAGKKGARGESGTREVIERKE